MFTEDNTWTRYDIELLIRARRWQIPYARIAQRLGRTRTACYRKMQALQATEQVNTRRSRLKYADAESEAQIAELFDELVMWQRMTLREVHRQFRNRGFDVSYYWVWTRLQEQPYWIRKRAALNTHERRSAQAKREHQRRRAKKKSAAQGDSLGRRNATLVKRHGAEG